MLIQVGLIHDIADVYSLKSDELLALEGFKEKKAQNLLDGVEASIERTDAKKMIEAHGGKVTGSVSKKTTHLLAGARAGSKLAKAGKLGVTVVSEAECFKTVPLYSSS